MSRHLARVKAVINKLNVIEYRIEVRECRVGDKDYWVDMSLSYATWRAACLATLKMGYDVNVVTEVY